MTNFIPTDFYEKARDSIVMTARKQNIARTLMPARLVSGGLGTMQYSFDTSTEVSDALLSWAITDNSEDVVGRSREHMPIPVLHKEWRIGRRDMAAAANGNYDLNMRTVNSAAYRVANLENQIVIDGYSEDDGATYAVKGLYQSAGNDVSDTLDFATSGNALKAVKAAVNVFNENDIFSNLNMILNPVQYTDLATSIFGTAKEGSLEMPMVEKLLGGNIIKTNWVAEGTGMIVAQPTGGFYEMIVPQDITYESEILQKSKDLWGRVYEAVLPVVYEPNAICTLSSIGA